MTTQCNDACFVLLRPGQTTTFATHKELQNNQLGVCRIHSLGLQTIHNSNSFNEDDVKF